MPFFKENPGILKALQRMDEKFVKQHHPLNSISKIHDIYRRSEKPDWASLKRDGLDRASRMLWAIEHMEHIVERLNVAPGSLSSEAIRTSPGMLELAWFKQDLPEPQPPTLILT